MAKIQLQIVIVGLLLQQIYGKTLLTQIQCTVVDKEFAKFDKCIIKPIQNIPSISITLRLLKLPVTNCLVHVELHMMRSLNSPILINGTWDGCAFLTDQSKFKFFQRLYGAIGKYSNLNHSCPYNHDVYLVDVVPPHVNVPLPPHAGEFLFKTSYIIDGEMRLKVDGRFTIKT